MSWALYVKYRDKRFIAWGICGIIGIIGTIVMWPIPAGLLKLIVLFGFTIPYAYGIFFQTREITRLIIEQQKHKQSETEEVKQ